MITSVGLLFGSLLFIYSAGAEAKRVAGTGAAIVEVNRYPYLAQVYCSQTPEDAEASTFQDICTEGPKEKARAYQEAEGGLPIPAVADVLLKCVVGPPDYFLDYKQEPNEFGTVGRCGFTGGVFGGRMSIVEQIFERVAPSDGKVSGAEVNDAKVEQEMYPLDKPNTDEDKALLQRAQNFKVPEEDASLAVITDAWVQVQDALEDMLRTTGCWMTTVKKWIDNAAKTSKAMRKKQIQICVAALEEGGDYIACQNLAIAGYNQRVWEVVNYYNLALLINPLYQGNWFKRKTDVLTGPEWWKKRLLSVYDILSQAEYCPIVRSVGATWDSYYIATLKTLRELVTKKPTLVFSGKDVRENGQFEDKVLPRVEAMVDALCQGKLIEAEMNLIAAFFGNYEWDVDYETKLTEVWSQTIADMAANPMIKDKFQAIEGAGLKATPARFFQKVKMVASTADEELKELKGTEWKNAENYLAELFKVSVKEDAESDLNVARKEAMEQVAIFERWACAYPSNPVMLWQTTDIELTPEVLDKTLAKEVTKIEEARKKALANKFPAKVQIGPPVVTHTHTFLAPSAYQGSKEQKEPTQSITAGAHASVYYGALMEQWLQNTVGLTSNGKWDRIKLMKAKAEDDATFKDWLKGVVQEMYEKGQVLRPLRAVLAKASEAKTMTIELCKATWSSFWNNLDEKWQGYLKSKLRDGECKSLFRLAASETDNLGEFVDWAILALVDFKGYRPNPEDKSVKEITKALFDEFFLEYPESYGEGKGLKLDAKFKQKVMKDAYYASLPKLDEEQIR